MGNVYTPARMRHVLQMYNDGVRMRDIAATIGISRDMIRRWLLAYRVGRIDPDTLEVLRPITGKLTPEERKLNKRVVKEWIRVGRTHKRIPASPPDVQATRAELREKTAEATAEVVRNLAELRDNLIDARFQPLHRLPGALDEMDRSVFETMDQGMIQTVRLAHLLLARLAGYLQFHTEMELSDIALAANLLRQITSVIHRAWGDVRLERGLSTENIATHLKVVHGDEPTGPNHVTVSLTVREVPDGAGEGD